ncbi:MAG: dipicolinate synthase subunit A [Ruminococcus sp.]|nr:dipicolinate synthase subunit A [Ruminococcus sp.]
MDKRKKVLIAGGDMRQIYCGERLCREYDIYTIGIDREHFSDKLNLPEADETMAGVFDCAVLPVTPPDESGNIFTPLFSGTLNAAYVKKLLKSDAVVFTGISSRRTADFFPNHLIFSYMDREELAVKNAVPTAEGAVMLALEELPVTLNGLPVLIAGAGRIGTSLAIILKGFGADITIAVHNSKGAAKAGLLGVRSVYTEKIDGNYGLVFNTVPSVIFTEDVLEKFPENTLFIDLASRPGGFDLKSAEKTGRRVIWALGVPGKNAPKTAGTAVAETIIEMTESAIY